MNKDYFFFGQPVYFQKGISVYPPTCQQVLTEKDYNAYVQALTYSQEEIEDIFVEGENKPEEFPTPLEFLLSNCYNNKNYEAICKKSFSFFLHTEANFLYEEKMVLLGNLEEVVLKIQNSEDLQLLPLITENNFFDLQNLIREATGQKQVELPNQDEHPKIKAMKAKQRLRDKIKAKSGKGISTYDSLVAICCMGIGINPLNIGEMSYVAAKELLDRYQAKEKYDLDIRSILAGADSKKIKPKYWMEKIEN